MELEKLSIRMYVWIRAVDEEKMKWYGCNRGSVKKKMKSKGEFLRKDLKSICRQIMAGLQFDGK